MSRSHRRNEKNPVPRRTVLRAIGAGAAWACLSKAGWTEPTKDAGLSVGEGVADITPPEGVELAGFHRPPGQERRSKGVREPSSVRALVFEVGGVRAAVVSLELLAVGQQASERIRRKIAQGTGIAPGNIKLCATHTHSMPSLQPLRQWGSVSPEYLSLVEERTVTAVAEAVGDLAPAQLKLGRATVKGGNFNRTTSSWKTEDAFDDQASDQDRWFDRDLHALLIEREGRKNLLWYHFSAHPVCFADEWTGPDWPALVAHRAEARWGIAPGYLQGHIGDVNPGDGNPWRGDADKTANAVWAGLEAAVNSAQPLDVDRLEIVRGACTLPLDVERWFAWVEEYRRDPEACKSGVWVDAPFAAAWFDANKDRDPQSMPHQLPTELACWRLGPLHLLFHGGELYSYYGLWMRKHSPSPHTLVVGYADDFVGYLTDPRAHAAAEYAAVVVPKILDLPPFQPNAAEVLARGLVDLARETAVAPATEG